MTEYVDLNKEVEVARRLTEVPTTPPEQGHLHYLSACYCPTLNLVNHLRSELNHKAGTLCALP